MTTISVVGQGKLGKPIADVFEQKGYEVIRIDSNPKLGSTSYKKLGDITFIIVPTPSDYEGKFISDYVEAVLRKISQAQIVVIVSTLMPGETDRLQKKYKHLTLLYNPTFVALGSVEHDFLNPDFILIGANNQEAKKKLKTIYLGTISCDTFAELTPLEAEIAKLSLNCYITTKITFANQIGNLCYNLGISPRNILNAIGMDSRIGNKYFKAGLGYGGPCFPRDNIALSAYMSDNNVMPDLFRTIHSLNEKQIDKITTRILSLDPESVGFPGLSYKQGTDVTENSQLKAIYEKLKENKIKVKIGKGDVNINWEGEIK